MTLNPTVVTPAGPTPPEVTLETLCVCPSLATPGAMISFARGVEIGLLRTLEVRPLAVHEGVMIASEYDRRVSWRKDVGGMQWQTESEEGRFNSSSAAARNRAGGAGQSL